MIVIFDIDNCIADDSHRRHLIDPREPDIDEQYRDYHEQMHKDVACNKNAVIDHINSGDTIAFVTGRPELYRQQTWNWLRKNFPELPIETKLIMRPDGDHTSSCELKPRLVQKHINDIHQIFCAYDDLPEVIEAYKEIGIANVKQLCAPKTAPDILQEAAKTFKQRNALYGNSYKSYGKVMLALFPNGLELDTIDEWNRFGVFSMIVSKVMRYAASMEDGGHKDSAHDMIVYAAMLEELTK